MNDSMNLRAFGPRAIVRISLVVCCFGLVAFATGSAGAQSSDFRTWLSENKQEPKADLLTIRKQFKTAEQFIAELENGIAKLDDRQEQTFCLKALVELWPQRALASLHRLAGNDELDPTIRAQAVYLSSLYRDPTLLPSYQKLLDHEQLSLRAAALDAIGILRQPAYALNEPGSTLATDPPIGLNEIGRLAGLHGEFEGLERQDIALFAPRESHELEVLKLGDREYTEKLRQRLVQSMLSAKFPVERRAAARSLVNWHSPDYQLRAAEWGVWISNSENEFQLAESVLADIPSFVFRTQNPIDEFAKRVNKIMFITKPVLHLTADQPLSVDVTADIAMGQPWFAYPKPSDFHLVVELSRNGLASDSFDPFYAILKKHNPMWPIDFDEAQSGYPWIESKERRYGGMSSGMGAGDNRIIGIGLQWEHLIVSPEQQDWMELPVVLKKHQWWQDLRKVKSNWISDGTQAERFLYYDGPSIAKSPVTVSRSGQEMKVAYQRAVDERLKKTIGFHDPAQTLLIQVEKGKAKASHFEFLDELKITVDSVEWSEADQAVDQLRQMITKYNGLTDEEAAGLINTWRPQFFETDGTRLLVRINGAEYDRLCPLQIRPAPTELARVGLVLYEFQNQK